MEKSVVFSNKLLPYLLLIPQLIITFIFFYWPASQAVWQSFLREDAFGLTSEFVGLENYQSLFAQPEYYAAMLTTVIFSSLVAALSLSIALLFATQADKNLKAAGAYKTLMIWPYAVAPAVAGVLWIFMFHPSLGTLARPLRFMNFDWNPLLNGTHAMALVVMAAVWKQISYNFLFFLAGLQSIPKSVLEAGAIDGAGPLRRFWTITFPLLSPTTFFLLVVNVVYVFFDTFGIIDAVTGGGPAGATTTLVYKVFADGRLGRAVGDPDDHRDRADRDPVPLCRTQGAVLMVEHRPLSDIIAYAILTLGVFIVAFPVYLALIASTHDAATVVGGNMPLSPGSQTLENYYRAIFVGGARTSREPVGTMLMNSFISAIGIAVGKIFISMLSAYAVVYFRFPFRKTAFWIIFITLMLPVEVRIYPTYKVVADLKMLDTYAGLILPLIASATGTLLFRQFFMTIPEELLEASRIDGAGPFRFFFDTLLPLSVTTIAALFVIQFIYGWNQYLWPLLITTQDSMQTIVTGIKKMLYTTDELAEWQLAMATAILAMLPPVAVVVFMQRLFVRGLVETEK